VCVVGVAGLLLAGCGASASDIGGGKLTATGCQPHLAVGHQMKIRVRWTAPKIAKYTLVRLDGARDFTVNSVDDEAMSRGQPNGVNGEYDLPGPRSAKTAKTIVAVIGAARAGDHNTIKLSVWGSGDALSAPPSDVASVSCSVAVRG
jgi:hypothetical protein